MTRALRHFLLGATLAGLAGLGLGAAVARAEEAPALSMFDKMALRDACQADFTAACAGLEPGGGRVKQCAATHYAEFSAPCQSTLVRLGIVPAPPPAPAQ